MKDHSSNCIIWIGEPIVRIGNKTFYSKFKNGKLKGKIGSFFRVSSPDHNGKPKQVVQIVQLYEIRGTKKDEHRAIVKWFVDCASLSKNIINYKSIKHKLSFATEVILDDTKGPDDDISIKKLEDRCHVIFRRTVEGPSSVPRKRRPVYLCRYKVTEQCGRPKVEPYFSDDEDAVIAVSDAKLHMEPVVKLERMKLERKSTSLPGSPRIPRTDRGSRLCGIKSTDGKHILVKKAAVPDGEVFSITDSESENESESGSKNTIVPVRKLPNTKLTEEEIVSLLTADDDIDSDDNIFSEFEKEESDNFSDETQSSLEHSDIIHVRKKLVLRSSSYSDASSNNNSRGRQRRTRVISSSDDDFDERSRVKRPKLDLSKTPTSSPKQFKKPQLPQKDESTLPVSEARMSRTSPTKNRPSGLKLDEPSRTKASSRTPKKNVGLQAKPADSPAIQRTSETHVMRASPTKSRLSELKDNVPSEPKASSRSPTKKLISELQSIFSDSPAIQTSESRPETPKKSGRIKSGTPLRPFEKTLFAAQDSADDAPRRLSPRTPVRNKRYDDSWSVDTKMKSQQKSGEEERNHKETPDKTHFKVHQLNSNTSSPRTPRSRKQLKAVEEEEEIQQDKLNLASRIQQLSSNISSPRTPRSRKLKAVEEEEEIQQDELNLASRIQQLSSNTGSPRTPRSRRKAVEEEQEDRQVHIKSSTRVQLATSNNPNSPRTPKSKKGSSVHRALLTPSMPSRGHSVESPSSVLEIVRSRLCVSAVPKSLPCREYEFNNIYHFLEGKIIDRASGCMYVSGVPGTGKTATVQEVLRSLKNKADCNEIPAFDLVELNGMRMTEPRQAYVQLYRALTGQTVVADQAQQLLEKRFSTSKKKQDTTVVIVDELDMLCTRRQDVVYNLLDWPTKASSHLVVVTIANTMDLPEKLLKGRVTSRLGLTRVTFQPYTFQQLQTIVMERLGDLNVFDYDAVELVSRKVAAVSGDARRALDICRRATELAEGKADLVGMQHVDEAVQEMSTSATVRMIKNCSTLEQNFLKAVLARMQASGIDETSFRTVYDQLLAICTFDGIKVPSVTEALQICAALGSARLLIVKHSRYDIHQDILLNVSCDDLHYALKAAAA